MRQPERVKFRYESRCRCGKLLTKPMVSIEIINASLAKVDMNDIVRKHIKIKYGAQTMCRKCKKLYESLEISKEKDLLVNSQ